MSILGIEVSGKMLLLWIFLICGIASYILMKPILKLEARERKLKEMMRVLPDG